MTEAEYTELKQKEQRLYATYLDKKEISDKAGYEWSDVHNLIKIEDQRREIIKDMKAKGEIPA